MFSHKSFSHPQNIFKKLKKKIFGVRVNHLRPLTRDGSETLIIHLDFLFLSLWFRSSVSNRLLMLRRLQIRVFLTDAVQTSTDPSVIYWRSFGLTGVSNSTIWWSGHKQWIMSLQSIFSAEMHYLRYSRSDHFCETHRTWWRSLRIHWRVSWCLLIRLVLLTLILHSVWWWWTTVTVSVWRNRNQNLTE